MRLIVEIPSGPLSGQQIKVAAGQTVRVGRTRRADVVLDDSFLSGVHFALECSATGCRVKDLNSSNGTKLNGKLIIDAPLKSGDKLFAGRTDFNVRLENEKGAVTGSRSRLTRADSAARRKPSKNFSASQGGKRLSKSDPSLASTDRKKKVQTKPPQPAPVIENAPPPDLPSPAPVSPAKAMSPALIDSYYAATADGRLFQILSDQKHPLMALVDAVHDAKVLELLRAQGQLFQSLYRNEQAQTNAPYLVRLSPRSELLRQMIQQGWGRGWGVYLTSALSLEELRQYYRTTLMVIMPDGMELFSRFYDPRFFRGFLESSTAAEAEPFFGPVVSYFMEDERPEILLQFTKSQNGAEKKGHLLSALS